jgi:2'-hydroxyisoflavone reductase
MRILVLGGTAFVGRTVVTEALAAGWEVTTFNRGISGEDVDGVRSVRGDRMNADDVRRLAAWGGWDLVVDTSGYVPRNVLAVVTALEPVANRFLFMSTVSVYADWPVKALSEDSPVLQCPPDAGPDFGEDVEDGPTQYGYQKSGCEAAVRQVYGEERCTVLRPGVVLGPREYIGRLPWWLRRIATGGRVIAPGKPGRSIQPVDVRDLAGFALRCGQDGQSGVFNVTAPTGRESFGAMLASCAEVTRSTAELVWVPDGRLLGLGVRQWSEMPLWRTSPGVWQVDSSRAVAAGLRCRPLADTVADTWAWLVATGTTSSHERADEIGVRPDREQEILAKVS